MKGVARLGSGKSLPDKGIHVIPTGDSLVVELPGGGGFGDPRKRSKTLVEADVNAGVVSADSAFSVYQFKVV
jgi:N-methylhydantoinase B/oxoprolinase/acetone carboxylase alpha subunit